MNIVRFVNRHYRRIMFLLRNRNVCLVGKGLIKNAECMNSGYDNCISIDAGASLCNCKFYFKGNKNRLHVKCGSHLKNITFWFEDDNNRIEIGESVTSEGILELAACESKSIVVGNDCMFSYGIHIRTTDSHSIIDDNGNRINYGADISIGNHVWVGAESMILKGCVIPDNCVIGARSMVTSSLRADSNSMIVGSPAKMIKGNINWKRERI